MYVTIACQCENGHEWKLFVPNYWFNLSDCRCKECDKPVSSMKSGEILEEVKKRSLETQQ